MLKSILEWLAILALLFLIGLTAGKIGVAYEEYKRDAAITERFEKRLEQTKLRLSKTQENLHRLQKDNAYYERLIREKLGWVKDGERIYILDE